MKIYRNAHALFSNFNSKKIRGINFGKKRSKKYCKSRSFASAQMIDQTFRIKALKDKVVRQNMVIKSKMCFS